MPRATIRDVARHAKLSISTVNRALHEPGKVRQETIESVLQAAEEVGFYGIASIRGSLRPARPKVAIGILLLQRNRALYRNLGARLAEAARALQSHDVTLRIDHLDELSPQNVADSLYRLAETSVLIGVVATEHPIISATIEALADKGVRVFALISQLTARCPTGYVGIDMWKAGRTAGWALQNLARRPGKIGILVGNHRYRCQETAESGFRSYMREHPSGDEILEAESTFETASIAQELTERMIKRNPDLTGLFINGGGASGALAAVRESGRAREIVSVGFDLTDTTRAALLDGTMNFIMAHPVPHLAQEALAAMLRCNDGGPEAQPASISLPFDIYTPENL